MPTTVAAAFNQLLADLRLTKRQRSLAAGRVAHLRDFFKDYPVTRAPWAIGSYGRGTIVRWERDIDIMVALDAATYWPRYRQDSRRFLHTIRDTLDKAYPRTTVSSRQIAVQMLLGADLQVDLVPALAVADVPVPWLFRPLGAPKDRGLYIPDGHGGWQKTNPPFHDNLVRTADQRLGGTLKPLIRVMKAWNLAHYHRLHSFHLEMLVAHAWSREKALPPLAEAVAETLRRATRLVEGRFRDPWADADTRLDDYLDGATRARAARSLRDDAARAREALAHVAAGRVPEAFARWAVVFGHEFPAFG